MLRIFNPDDRPDTIVMQDCDTIVMVHGLKNHSQIRTHHYAGLPNRMRRQIRIYLTGIARTARPWDIPA